MDRQAASPHRFFHPHNAMSVLAHVVLFSLSLLAAFVLAYNFARTDHWFFPQYLMVLPAFLLVKYVVFEFLHQHERSWRHVGYRDFFDTVWVCLTSSAVLFIAYGVARRGFVGSSLSAVIDFPSSVFVIDLIIGIVLVTWSRAVVRYYYEQGRSSGTPGTRTLIIGAGDAGATLLREIQHLNLQQHRIVGFLDDDPHKQGTRIHGIPVLGPITDVKTVCTQQAVAEVLIAIPSAPRKRIREIIQLCEGANLSFRIMPNLSELIEGTLTLESQLRQIKVEDLLHRPTITLDHQAISEYLRGKKVLVTGAGGSIGSEMCRQILRFEPATLVLVELSENNLFNIERELRGRRLPSASAPQSSVLRCYLGDICDRSRMQSVFHREKPDFVCHAAAHKHVPMLEAHPGEGLKNNIVGTRMLAGLSVEHGVHKFVYISTDKAVNPTSIMGCTKRIAEMFVQGLSERSHTRFITVRFGNVLGSSGSVVPIFQEQIAKGGPVTVTHPDITRYFMTIPEAAQLVLQAGAIGKGGEIFLLEMGEPVKIADLARNLITLSGLTPEVDVEIQFTGLRPGEKLYEELYIEGEGLLPTSHPNISAWEKRAENWDTLVAAIPELLSLADDADLETIKNRLASFVPEYQPHYKPAPPGSRS